MVDFTRKIAEEVKSTCTLYMGSPYTLPSYYTSGYIYKYKNEVGCRDDTVPKTVDTRRHCEEE